MRRIKSARFRLSAILVTLLSVWSFAAIQQAFAWGTPTDLPLDGVPCESTACGIYTPRITGEGKYVHLIYAKIDLGNIYYNRGLTDATGKVTWERAVKIASNTDKGGNNSWDIIADPNGTIHVAYYSNGSLYYIKNTSEGAGAWTSPERIDTTGNRAYGLSITLDTEGTPYVAWGSGINKGGLRFAYRNSDGSWTPQDAGIDAYFVRFPDIAVTGGGASAVIHVMAEVERKQTDGGYAIYYTRAPKGGTIANSNFSSAFNSDPSSNRPSITVDRSTNVIYSGFVGGNNGDGYYTNFSYSRDQGATWSKASKVSFGTGFWSDLTPMVAADNVVYMMLPAKDVDGVDIQKIGLYDVRYNATSNSFTSPVAILNYQISNNKVTRDVDYALNSLAKVGVWIRNFIDGPGYNSDPGGANFGSVGNGGGGGGGGSSVNGQLAINNGAATTTNATVTITIANVTGTPTRMRVAIDTAMSDAIPLEPFQTSFTRTFANLSVCSHTVSVTLVNDAGVATASPLQDTIIVDASVQASVMVGNPYKRGNAAIFSQIQDTNIAASDGDRQYTRVPALYAEINGAGECGALKQVRLGRTVGAYNYTQVIGANFYASPMFIPGAVVVGPNQIALEVQDNAGNTQTYTRTIYYDPTPPTLVTQGRMTVQAPTTGPNILTTLAFSGSVVTDDMYPNGYWGMWIANSRTPITNPISDTNLVWSPIQRPSASQNFSLSNWSVLSGLPGASQTPGIYYVYVRFLDGAGNPTSGVLTGTVTLNTIVKPTVRLPIVVR